MASPTAKRILVAPLDWGLGHATRCIPIIRLLLSRGHEVMVAGDTGLLSETFPGLASFSLVRYNMTYAATPFGMALKFPAMVLRVLRKSRQEHRELEALIEKHRIDVVISDQRFGCYSAKARSIYLTHQLCVKMPNGFGFFEALVARSLRYAANRFHEVWVPDVPGQDNLTGDLTQKYPAPNHRRFIGVLSRFGTQAPAIGDGERIDLLVMLSGPEPQRTMFERKVLSHLRAFSGAAIVLLGRPNTILAEKYPHNIQVFAHLPSADIERFIRGANAIVCRGGYTTIMDLVSLKKKALLVPTPGQSEQEYLCARLSRSSMFASMDQETFDLRKGMDMLQRYSHSSLPKSDTTLLIEAFEANGL
ncbi:MAG: hypothetical protein A2268_07380 [Candidatus Raymondbacteria bacterium RifOxyA12_full_50_37]|uniref:Glycosyl transferase family 28 C-terminal domain-containing protein n=1 Tax=Candidatus Raymondbacteria bacterium RIFOXYD12_FULL_49_13 TaxID=1817890 RepID=A0A1F7F5Z3_UNCRA|nr:MAG: hypothetical protein A2268_07380 [Candidatus Raymondbacteria bacterium RifOxyA12_full_50_37]OGJ91203.1 MAG: hypothetical protein A2248_01525 [Candidatus Raymondbacteria bacterium RIFOXYA2_FULL_49_16]OGJ95380.1 MAG: hypothetical protein A2487_18115 [Candidatus Raymondbacteria bacterium RifOxyC12_full_50_8]OGJ97601.1 MAG: hypothetical protein A2453_02290 [Candidatus Raymondbacteria bacterium RIFOXYC2_FULL_50_21]OGK02059.1 MAG: hypothetical protein A2519_18735 [Candidatus Raymondbacteria b